MLNSDISYSSYTYHFISFYFGDIYIAWVQLLKGCGTELVKGDEISSLSFSLSSFRGRVTMPPTSI